MTYPQLHPGSPDPWAVTPAPLAPRYTETQHVLHLVLTLLTAGLWGVVWLAVAVVNSSANAQRRTDYEQQYASWQHACWIAQNGR